MAAAARALVVDLHFLEDLEFWVTTDRKTALKVVALDKLVKVDTE